LSEKGDIAFSPDIPLDESCYREAQNADVLVLIIGGRYGSGAGGSDKKPPPSFFDRYDTITKQEYKSAINNNVPIYILIESNVYTEYFTWLKNKGNTEIAYAHVDSVNIFELIQDILSQSRNNPVFHFEKYSDVELWLREQWAGLFKDLLSRMSQQQQIATLESKVSELGEINLTLRRYMEAIISKLEVKDSKKLIKTERKRLEQVHVDRALRDNRFVQDMITIKGWTFEEVWEIINKSSSFEDFIKRLRRISGKQASAEQTFNTLSKAPAARSDLNEARKIVGKPEFEDIDKIAEF